MRNLVTATGRRQHIVRENSYHGLGRWMVALCGVEPKRVGNQPMVGQPDAFGRRCKTCKRLYDGGAR